ncbi:MAG: hypothetical protein JNM18_24725, partial [Planctomycetaceae bacterium]|nr:hypothetical protein [Planctomycetaceae bacterium]
MRHLLLVLATVLVTCSTVAQAADQAKAPAKTNAPAVAPTAADVRYGEHERQMLDFYQAKSDQPTPV